jgi:methionyl-tRNA formyltransferase
MKTNFQFMFVTQDDPFYVRCFFDEFFKVYPDLREIESVVIQRPMGKKTTGALIRQMVEFYGPLDFLRMGDRYARGMVLSQLSRMFPKEEWFDLKRLCMAKKIEVRYQDGIHQPEFLEQLRQNKIDLIVSVAAPTIFKKELFELPRLGCINIHHAPLPRYRGMMPNFWQLYHGEETVGITIHKINHQIDEGEIILQKQIPINPGESLDTLIRRTKRLGAQCMVEAIDMLKKNKVHYKENKPGEGSYFSFPTRRDVQRFRAMGNRLL